ncbi:(2Fe-2S)-binding protein [Hazenella sp. IB182357]|uniref:(2Fe-2S)-binding protein n=1 Tax=Polycladospora coralii TaxID=2771432 RepID=A0A926N9U1_9BACL|nr:2Fe-2S iron-sulfur cluster-binding protein [Polycladospora coralii]MBD1371195.1 (2Fe-2S)-binding protein [Polycladospora coralii]MBS7530137.1 (2Fe-2S)-binding protein [Polycladospora coralii]
MPTVKINHADACDEIEVEEQSNLLLAAISQNVPIPFRCTTGRCKTCLIEVVDGIQNVNEMTEIEIAYNEEHQLSDDFRLACQTFVYGDIEIKPTK